MQIYVGARLVHKTSGARYDVSEIQLQDDNFIARREADGLEVSFTMSKADRYFDYAEEQLPMGTQDFLQETKLNLRCECGVDSLGAGLHSNYCPKWGSNV